MAETEASAPSKSKEKAVCWRGAKCRRKNCKYAHPREPAANVINSHAGAHDSPLPQEPLQETHTTYTETQDLDSQENASKAPKKMATKKLCKFGNDCRRRNCKYLHPQQEEMMPSASSPLDYSAASNDDMVASATTVNENSRRQEGNDSFGTDFQGHDHAEIHDSAPAARNQPTHSSHKPKSRKSKKKCRHGTSCRKPDCPFRHPNEHSLNNGQQEENVSTVDVSAAQQEAEIPLAADLEESLVSQAQETLQQQESPVEKKKRRTKRDKDDARRRRQLEEDRLIQEEDERLKQKEEDEAAEQERLQQQEAEELDRMLQDQERQRQAEAELEQQRLAKEETERRLSAKKARIEIDLIRQGLNQKEQAKREGVPSKQEREAEVLRDPERVRAEREALERFKRLHEEQKKSEEAARRLEEEERKMQEQQEDLIRRERENEADLRRSAKKKGKNRRRSSVEADQQQQEASVVEEASKAQEDSLLDDMDDEERERYKAERKAAKKERRRLEKEAKAKAEGNGSTPSPGGKQARFANDESLTQSQSPTGSNQENIFETNTPEEEDEAAKKRRWQEELKRQKERAAEKREQKQKLRRERSMEDRERQTQERTQFWKAEIADEKATIDLLVQLCAAEFCRKNPEVGRETLLTDDDVKSKLVEAAQETYRAICKAEIHSRVAVKGMKQQDLNDRTGTIQSWDEAKGKFHVGLDTKKGKNTQFLYIPPANLEALPLPSPRKGKKRGDPVHMVFITSLFADHELMVDVYKSELDDLKKAASVDQHLEALMNDRDREEREAEELKEEERRQEEEARRRRAEQRHRENMEWERRQQEYAEQKAEYQEWHRQQREEKKARAQAHQRGERYYEDREHPRFCNCPRCELENMFFGGMGGGFGGGGGGRGPGIFFGMGPDGPSIFFSFGDDDYDDDYEDQWDRQWEQMHEQELAEKNLEATETLGVDVDATDAEIKRVFRKKARKYHPDSFRAANHEDGMTKEEAEEHFKELSNAYDHLMSNFDDDSDEE